MLLAQVVPKDVVDDVVEEFETLEARDWIIAGVIMLVAILIAGFAGRAAERRMGGATSLSAVTVARLTRLVVVVLGASVALWSVGVSLGPVLFFLLVLTFLLAVSFSIAVADFVAGTVLIARRPFDLGDLIRVGEHVGTVADHDMRAITLRTIDRETVTIPNRVAIGSVIVNATPEGAWRSGIAGKLALTADLATAKTVVEAAVRVLPGVYADPPAELRYTGFGTGWVEFEVIVFHAASIEVMERVRNEVVMGIHGALADAGIPIPVPPLDVRVRDVADDA